MTIHCARSSELRDARDQPPKSLGERPARPALQVLLETNRLSLRGKLDDDHERPWPVFGGVAARAVVVPPQNGFLHRSSRRRRPHRATRGSGAARPASGRGGSCRQGAAASLAGDCGGVTSGMEGCLARSAVAGSLVLLVVLLRGPAAAQEHEHSGLAGEKLGTVHFPTSCARARAAAFDRAVALLHSFEFGTAIEAFDAALGRRPVVRDGGVGHRAEPLEQSVRRWALARRPSSGRG